MKPARTLDSPMCLRFASLAAIAVILLRVVRAWVGGRLYSSIGLDYAIYGATAEAVTRWGWSGLYNLEQVTRAFAGWLSEDPVTIDPAMYVASPYPAPFLLPFFATNLLGHGGGFAAWTVVNVLLYIGIVRGVVRGSGRTGPLVNLAPYAFFPFLWTLYLGQLVIVMTFGLYRAMRAFEEDRDLAAGCWLGLLLLKPQFGPILAVILLAKRRWAALGGLALVAAGLAGSTFALVGVAGVRDYFNILRAFSGFRRVLFIVNPFDMINVRGILFHVLPESWSEEQATRLVMALSAVLVFSLVAVWWGPWNSRDERFPRRILATVIITLFAGFHSHVHAATLMIVPLLAAIRTHRDRDPLLNFYVLLVFVPTFSIAFDGRLEHCAWLIVVLMAGLYAQVLVELASGREKMGRRTAVGPPGPAPKVCAVASRAAACESFAT
jgi:hypothetical protein